MFLSSTNITVFIDTCFLSSEGNVAKGSLVRFLDFRAGPVAPRGPAEIHQLWGWNSNSFDS